MIPMTDTQLEQNKKTVKVIILEIFVSSLQKLGPERCPDNDRAFG